MSWPKLRSAFSPLLTSCLLLHQIPIVSIHAHTRGATLIYRVIILITRVFQFTRTREARQLGGSERPFAFLFQFTRTREARPKDQNDPLISTTFQFTRTREARLNRLLIILIRSCFNSRARARRDMVACPVCQKSDKRVSIHAHARGATHDRVCQNSDKPLFQFTRTREARHRFRKILRKRSRFNSRARARRDSW